MRLLLRSDLVVTPEGFGPAEVLVEKGLIRQVGEKLRVGGRYTEIDATGLVVMPGAVDQHTHLEMTVGGVRTADDWESGSLAALVGGTTTVVDFAEPGEDGSLMAGLRAAEALARKRSYVDYGFHMTVTDAADERLAEMEEVVRAGVTTFKTYTAYPDRLMLDEAGQERVLGRARELGALCLIHCEDGPAIEENVRRAVAAGDLSAAAHARCRPPETEERAVQRIVALVRRTGAVVCVAHVSTAGAAQAIREARAEGLPVFGETCPHYLWLEERRLSWPPPDGLCHICAPALRDTPHLHAVWQALSEGVLDVVSTDHCPFDWEGGKERGLVGDREDFTRTPGGLPGVETRLPLLWAGGCQGERFGLARFVELVSSGPARLMGLYPHKGAIQAGSDADLTLFDPDGWTEISAESLLMDVDHSPYEGMQVQGRVVSVIKAGQLVVDEGEIVHNLRPGRRLRRRTYGDRGGADE